jgi:RNA-directed DNA polymerase
MEKEFPKVHFERYADDIVLHCRSYKQLKFVESKLRDRFAQCKLELCPEKTKIVYCKDSNRNDVYNNQSFDFLGYTFRPRSSRCRNGQFFVSFSPAVSQKSLKAMRSRIKLHPVIKGCYSESIEKCARILNPIIQGWINYYGRFRKSSLSSIFRYINDKLTRWVMRKFKSLQRRIARAGNWLKNLYLQNNDLFAHWKYYNWVVE